MSKKQDVLDALDRGMTSAEIVQAGIASQGYVSLVRSAAFGKKPVEDRGRKYLELYLDGASLKDIAAEYGVTTEGVRSRIYGCLKRRGIAISFKHPGISEIYAADYAKHGPVAAAKIHGVTPSAIIYHAHKVGVPLIQPQKRIQHG